jgi:hypothetical protein
MKATASAEARRRPLLAAIGRITDLFAYPLRTSHVGDGRLARCERDADPLRRTRLAYCAAGAEVAQGGRLRFSTIA